MSDVKEDLIEQAWECEKWPDWLHTLVEKTNDVADECDMSSEQAIAYAVLSALAAPEVEAAVDQAAIAWCGKKERETSLNDITYFKNNWRALPGLRVHVAEALLDRALSAVQFTKEKE